ncbi:MAG: hypothetical protein GY929_13540 [Actinomycetia bacterium]|nr:hypothetical protein [Actinomycetes bacterium]
MSVLELRRVGRYYPGSPPVIALDEMSLTVGKGALAQLDADVQRNRFLDDSNGLDVLATEPQLLDTIQGEVAHGRFLERETAQLPTVVLGSVAAERLGITDLRGGPAVWVAGQRFAVIGILHPLEARAQVDENLQNLLLGLGAVALAPSSDVSITALPPPPLGQLRSTRGDPDMTLCAEDQVAIDR